MTAQRESSVRNQVLFYFESGCFNEAEELLKKNPSENGNSYSATARKVCKFWKDKQSNGVFHEESDGEGEFLFQQWFRFRKMYGSEMFDFFPNGYSSISHWLFNRVIDDFKKRFGSLNEFNSANCLMIARCFKYLGRYEDALPFINRILKLNKTSAEGMAELGDCYGLLNETELSKSLFREAFKIDPQSVDLEYVETPFFTALVKKIGDETSYKSKELKEWIPVYAVVLGVFDVAREMKQIEVKQLKQNIYSLKIRLKENNSCWKVVPRLLNSYFWLLDYYKALGKGEEDIRQILMDIKILDSRVYELYMC